MKKYTSYLHKINDSKEEFEESQITFLLHTSLNKSLVSPFYKKLLFIYEVEHEDYHRIDIEIYQYDYIIMNIYFNNKSNSEFIYYIFDNEMFDKEFQEKAITYKWKKRTQEKLFYIHNIISILLFYFFYSNIFYLFFYNLFLNSFLFIFF